MELLRVWTLRGANRWAPVPVLEVELDAGAQPEPDVAAIKDLALDYQRRCGFNVRFGTVAPMAGAGRHRVIFEFEEEAVANAALALALDTIRARLRGETLDPAPRLAELRDLGNDVRLG